MEVFKFLKFLTPFSIFFEIAISALPRVEMIGFLLFSDIQRENN